MFIHTNDPDRDHIAKYQELRGALKNGELGEIGRFLI